MVYNPIPEAPFGVSTKSKITQFENIALKNIKVHYMMRLRYFFSNYQNIQNYIMLCQEIPVFLSHN